MGTKFFHSTPGKMQTSGTNMAARAFGAPGYMARSAGGAASKDLGAASALSRTKSLKTDRSSAYGPGPKKV